MPDVPRWLQWLAVLIIVIPVGVSLSLIALTVAVRASIRVTLFAVGCTGMAFQAMTAARSRRYWNNRPQGLETKE